MLTIFAGCTGSNGQISNLLGGNAGIEIIHNPARVEAFRIGPPEPPTLDFIHWPVQSGPLVLDAIQTAEAASLILAGTSYDEWHSETGCGPQPGLKLMFIQHEQSRTLIFCFECDEVYAYDGSQKIGLSNIAPAHDHFLKFFIKMFPADKQLTTLLHTR